jgi:hypothetical protein
MTPTCPEGTFINERISWDDQKADHYDLFIDGTRGGLAVSPLAREIYKVSVGTTHTFQVKAYFSNGSSLLSETLTYTLEKNPCTAPVFPLVPLPAFDEGSDTLLANLLDPAYIQKLGGSATTLEPNVKLRLYTPSWGDTGSLESKRLPINPALPLVMERRIILAPNMDKAVCYITPVSSVPLGITYGVVHEVKDARTQCGVNATPSSVFLGGTCSAEQNAAIPTGTPFTETYILYPATGISYIFIDGKLSAMATLEPMPQHIQEITVYCHSERYEGGEVVSDYWKMWQEGRAEKKVEPVPAPSPSPVPVVDEFHATSAANTNFGKSLIFSHTSSASDGLLVVTVSTAADIEGVRSITYNGTTLTPAVGVDQSGRLSQIWYLVHPPAGTHDVAITAAGGDGRIIATAVSLTGSWTLGAVNKGVETGTHPEVMLTTQGGNSLLVSSLVTSYEYGPPSVEGSAVLRGSLKGFSGIWHSAGTQVTQTAGAHTISWRLTQSDLWGMAVAEFMRR